MWALLLNFGKEESTLFVITTILLSLILITLFSTLYFSLMSRRNQGKIRELHRARMNISMGILFLAFAIHLLMIAPSTWGYVLNTLILLIGLINLYYGFKQRRLLLKKE